MSVPRTTLAQRFQAERAHLIGVGYRLTGSLADAEDAVQEAWLRLDRVDPDTVLDLRAWLTTVVARIGLDRLRSAAVRREAYVGPWLPEPVLTAVDGSPDDPLSIVVRDDGVRMAAMVVLDRLSPDQRVALVLHDAFGVPFAEVATLLGCSEPTARQYATRARRAVADAEVPQRPAAAEQARLLQALVAALTSGDLPGVVRLLHPTAVLTGDADGRVPTARRPIVGADKIARFLVGLVQKYGPVKAGAGALIAVNGDLGMAMPHLPADEDGAEIFARVTTFAVRDGRIVAVYDIGNPAKLGDLTRLLTAPR